VHCEIGRRAPLCQSKSDRRADGGMEASSSTSSTARSSWPISVLHSPRLYRGRALGAELTGELGWVERGLQRRTPSPLLAFLPVVCARRHQQHWWRSKYRCSMRVLEPRRSRLAGEVAESGAPGEMHAAATHNIVGDFCNSDGVVSHRIVAVPKYSPKEIHTPTIRQ
jgi:hypothetical protein